MRNQNIIVSIDLHGTRHESVRSLLIRFIEDHWNQNVEAEIVTGHSDPMKQIVQEVLAEYKLACTVGDFAGNNTGMIRTVI